MSRRKRMRKRKCLHCGEMYMPDPRTRDRQKHCSSPECKHASKAWRQRRWLNKSENKDYFSGAENVLRVQLWRKANPQYWQRCRKPQNALQDDCTSQVIDNQEDRHGLNMSALQDDCLLQPAVVVGLIASLTGSTLQDDIALYVRKLHSNGQMILGIGSGMEKKDFSYDRKETVVPREGSPHSATL